MRGRAPPEASMADKGFGRAFKAGLVLNGLGLQEVAEEAGVRYGRAVEGLADRRPLPPKDRAALVEAAAKLAARKRGE